eukprot:TRINITY_DN17070_c0_g1_i3.p1 TRINITY_DN17070_c0_g1~~TRINITY_DN17070_c0_g1_i3.p1  ORF type:complete len:773 (+),score=135.79 TRINITY_DN17070_c0_g1_i3:191-2509(+)
MMPEAAKVAPEAAKDEAKPGRIGEHPDVPSPPAISLPGSVGMDRQASSLVGISDVRDMGARARENLMSAAAFVGSGAAQMVALGGTAASIDKSLEEAHKLSEGKPRTSLTGKRQAVFVMPEGVTWQWMHRTGFRDYSESQIEKIENAYQRGYSKCRLKSGKAGHTPMEVFFMDMCQFDPASGNSRQVQRKGPKSLWYRLRRRFREAYHAWYTGTPYRETFKDYQSRRAKIMGEEDSAEYDVTMLYDENSVFTDIVTSSMFGVVAMSVVLLNCFYIAVDLDRNKESTWIKADIGFQVAEHTFCVVFLLEIILRFLAFKRKRWALIDHWFKFDAFLVVLMVTETWILPLALHLTGKKQGNNGALGNSGILRLARTMRLARMTRLLKEAPELLTMLKGIAVATRSVMYTLLLLILLTYIFAVVFRSTTKDDGTGKAVLLGEDEVTIGEAYFSSVPEGMYSLFVHGTLLDAVSDVMGEMKAEEDWFVLAFFIIFIMLSSFTVLNMLIGILCDVVNGVKADEERMKNMFYLRTNLLDILDCYDKNGDQSIGRAEYQLLMKNPEVVDVLDGFGTDTGGLIQMVDILFEQETEDSAKGSLSFEEFITVVMRLQSAHGASVTDITDLREFTKRRVDKLQADIGQVKEAVSVLLEHVAPGAPMSESLSGTATQTLAKTLDAAKQDELKGSQATVDVTVCLLDARTRTMRMPKASTIKALLDQLPEQLGPMVATLGEHDEVLLGSHLQVAKLPGIPAEGPVTIYLKPDPWNLQRPATVASAT